jgi:Mrp family chromosome partitioning ATPase
MNLTADLSGLVDQLEPVARPGGRGRVLMLTSAGKGAGVSLAARELARLCAARSSRGVWLYDLDFAAGSAQARAARCQGAAYDASFGAPPFWAVSPASAPVRLVAQRSAAARLTVTALQGDPSRAKAFALRSSPAYWEAVRAAVDLAVIDAPADAGAAMALAPDVDGVILVADGRQPDFRALAERRSLIEAKGGVVAGLIVNRASGARSAA